MASACTPSQTTSTATLGAPSTRDGLSYTEITDGGLRADFFCEPSDSPRPVVFTLSGSEGGKWLSDNPPMIRALLDRGYCVLALAYFNLDGLPQHLRRIPLEYFETAFQWLATQDSVMPNDYALIGESRGAELALILASRYPQVAAVVALTPSSVSFPSPPTGLLDGLLAQHASWTYDGQELPFVPIQPSLEAGKAIITRDWNSVMMQALEDQDAVERATIPVEAVRGAILCISNTHDVVWPSTYSCEQIGARLRDRGFSYYFEHIAYDKPGTHAWCGEPCWREVVEFLSQHFQ